MEGKCELIEFVRLLDVREVAGPREHPEAATRRALGLNLRLVGREELVALADRNEHRAPERFERVEPVLAVADRDQCANEFLVRAGELERWLTQRKYTPPTRSLAKDLEEWDREAERSLQQALAEGSLRKLSPSELEEERAQRSGTKRR